MEKSIATFSAINLFDLDSLEKLSHDELRPVLPCLTRMAFCPSLDTSVDWTAKKKRVLAMITQMEEVNLILSLISVDFQSLDNEIKKSIRAKPIESPANLLVDMESALPTKKLSLFANEYFLVQQRIARMPKPFSRPIFSELFDHNLYAEVSADIMCVLLAELPCTFSLFDVVDTLLHVKTGSLLITRIALNFTHSFAELCQHLLERSERDGDNGHAHEQRTSVLRLLCQMNPKYALVVRSSAMGMLKLPALCVQLTIDHLDIKHLGDEESKHNSRLCNLMSFLSNILLGNDERTRNWFANFVRGTQKKSLEQVPQSPTVKLLRSELLCYLKYLVVETQRQPTQPVHIIQSSALLKLYCALRGLCAMKFTDDEVDAILDLIIIQPPANAAGIRFASIGLCMLLSCPSLSATVAAERKVVDWLSWIVKEESLFGQVSGYRSNFGEMLLLVAIHFHSNQTAPVVDLVCNALGIKMPIRQNQLIKMKTIFTQDIFPDHNITAHAIKVPVTPCLNSSLIGFMPVHCIYHLLKSRAFTKHKVPIKEWIFKQLCNSIAPLHPVLPSLLETYVNSVLIPCQKNVQGYTNEPISEDELLSVFNYKIYSMEENMLNNQQTLMEDDSRPVCYLTTQLLLLYYVLLYEDTRVQQSRLAPGAERNAKKYSPELFSKIPIYYLLQEARQSQHKYGTFYPSLLKLVSTHHPHLCMVTDWVYSGNVKMSTEHGSIALDKLKQALQNAFDCVQKQPTHLANLCEKIHALPSRTLWPLAQIFVANLPKLLPITTSNLVLNKAKHVWWRLNDIFPEEFRVMTVNAIALNKFTFRKLNWKDIVSDPLQVLRCDERVFICPVMIEILLHILHGFLVASPTFLMHHLLETPSKSLEEEKERDELRFALLQSQESAAIQILLEACRERPDFADNEELQSRLSEVQRLVCIHLHQVFIADPNLAKLVHFQGYDSSLLSLVVAKVPSMHICLDFIPELLSQPDLNKQVFSIELCSFLAEQYAIPKSLSIARLCFNVSNTLLSILTSEKRAVFFVPVLPALIRMCGPFPPLYEDALHLLIQISHICLSNLAAKNPTFISPTYSISSQTCVEDLDWVRTKKFFNSLPHNNVLSNTIRNAFNSLLKFEGVQKLIKRY